VRSRLRREKQTGQNRRVGYAHHATDRQRMQKHNEDRALWSSTQWQQKSAASDVRAGDAAAAFLKRHQRQFAKNAALADAWNQLIPAGMKPYCRLDEYRGGVLTVQARPGAYMHQLQLMQHELVAALQRECPRTPITKLRICPMKKENEE